jgi:hypothetical protein
MSEEPATRPPLSRRSREEADAIVREFRASGLTRRAFCVAKGLSLYSLDWYCSRRRTRTKTNARAASGKAPQWVKVETPVAPAPIRVVCGERLRVEVQPGFDAATLRQVIELLGSR